MNTFGGPKSYFITAVTQQHFQKGTEVSNSITYLIQISIDLFSDINPGISADTSFVKYSIKWNIPQNIFFFGERQFCYLREL